MRNLKKTKNAFYQLTKSIFKINCNFLFLFLFAYLCILLHIARYFVNDYMGGNPCLRLLRSLHSLAIAKIGIFCPVRWIEPSEILNTGLFRLLDSRSLFRGNDRGVVILRFSFFKPGNHLTNQLLLTIRYALHAPH